MNVPSRSIWTLLGICNAGIVAWFMAMERCLALAQRFHRKNGVFGRDVISSPVSLRLPLHDGRHLLMFIFAILPLNHNLCDLLNQA
jgi:hypothetical protein